MIPRIAVIQDLSCVGRCSLGVAMSVLPAMGLEVAALPTALLSTHTAFEGFTFVDLSSEMERIMAHWRALKMKFDAIYIGYLGSIRLIELAERFINLFRAESAHVILDPAFGDNGALYTGFDGTYVARLRKLCEHADVILPNVTEACFLLDLPWEDSAACAEHVRAEAHGLLGDRLRNVLITSCRFPDDRTGLICAGTNDFLYPHDRLALSCPGSGDLFASVFAGLMTLGRGIRASACIAADFTRDCIEYSMNCGDHRWYGVDFEPMLGALTRRIGEENA
ncbi:MAG: pyridoxamine kinase [Clostridia bacterium]|nr:pyridoxamine kinase [Clostridia bacterium]